MLNKGTTGEEALRREGGIHRVITKATCEVIGAFERGESVKYLNWIVAFAFSYFLRRILEQVQRLVVVDLPGALPLETLALPPVE